jgi:hypothetical protein
MEEATVGVLAALRQWNGDAADQFAPLLAEFARAEALNPRVVEYKGCLLTEYAVESPHLAEWFSGKYSDVQIEYVLNHVHLWDVIWMPSDGKEAEKLTERLSLFLPLLAEFWRWSLAKQTAAPIEVWTAGEPEEYGPTIGFNRRR